MGWEILRRSMACKTHAFLVAVLVLTGCEKAQAPPTTEPVEAAPSVDAAPIGGGDEEGDLAPDEGSSSISEVPQDLTVNIVIPGDLPAFQNATVRVRVEDVSVADAPATVVAKATEAGIGREEGDELTLMIPVRRPVDIDESKHYSVAVHIDLDGDGEVDANEFVTTVAIPVFTQGASTTVMAVVSPAS